jgi:hypothetical protein
MPDWRRKPSGSAASATANRPFLKRSIHSQPSALVNTPDFDDGGEILRHELADRAIRTSLTERPRRSWCGSGPAGLA